MLAAADGIYGNSKEEAVYPIYLTDSNGQKLEGATSRYALRIPPDQFPPANAFWSLTMYEMPTRSLVANPLNRYLINSAMLPDLERDSDDESRFTYSANRPARTKSQTGCRRPTVHSFSRCVCIGRNRRL